MHFVALTMFSQFGDILGIIKVSEHFYLALTRFSLQNPDLLQMITSRTVV